MPSPLFAIPNVVCHPSLATVMWHACARQLSESFTVIHDEMLLLIRVEVLDTVIPTAP